MPVNSLERAGVCPVHVDVSLGARVGWREAGAPQGPRKPYCSANITRNTVSFHCWVKMGAPIYQYTIKNTGHVVLYVNQCANGNS